MTGTDDTPRVWVGCLGCYNAGNLVGEWFDAQDAPTSMDEWHDHPNVKGGTWVPKFRIPHTHYESGHEELWCFDHENFHGLLTGECSPSEARRLAGMLEESGDPAAFGAYADNEGRDYATVDGFREAFCGEYRSEEEYAQELAEELGYVDDSARWPMTCIDWSHAWNELRIGGDNWSAPAPGGNVYIFRSI